ncbi:MAG: M23 family metallopeptidase [Balneolaceae bacterium]
MKYSLFTLLLSVLLYLLPGRVAVVAQDLSFLEENPAYLWPTDASPYLSSTFGETRSAHFHAGLDIRTWGREGYQVFAARDGEVYRIMTGPKGYGNGITLKHEDGSFSIYAHLNRFEPYLQAWADSIRMADYQFEMDERVEPGTFTVRQGERIGYTGSTGVGPPHLHFELRTPDNHPFNPLLTNLSIDDNLPPVFSSLAVTRLDPQTLQPAGTELLFPERRDGEFHFGSMDTDGPFGLAVNAHDRANNTPNVYAVYTLTLIHEADTLYHGTKNYFSYDDAPQMFIDRDFQLLREQRQGYQRLYVTDGNSLPFYQTDARRGVVDLPEGNHELKIIAADYFGNRATGRLSVQVRDRFEPVTGQIERIPAYPAPQKQEDLQCRPVAPVQAQRIEPEPLFHTPSPHEPDSSVLNGARICRENRSDEQSGGPRESTTRILRKKLAPNENQVIELARPSLRIQFSEKALFDTLNLEVELSEIDDLPVIRFHPGRIPLQSHATIQLILDEPASGEVSRYGLYSYDERRERYSLVGSSRGTQLIRGRFNELQTLYVLEDLEPPTVGPARMAKTLGGAHVVHIEVLDEMSGIDYQHSEIRVNGLRGITEYDPEKERLTFYLPGFTPEEENRVSLTVLDGVGNRTERSWILPEAPL